jgi:hypothetical protein
MEDQQGTDPLAVIWEAAQNDPDFFASDDVTADAPQEDASELNQADEVDATAQEEETEEVDTTDNADITSESDSQEVEDSNTDNDETSDTDEDIEEATRFDQLKPEDVPEEIRDTFMPYYLGLKKMAADQTRDYHEKTREIAPMRTAIQENAEVFNYLFEGNQELQNDADKAAYVINHYARLMLDPVEAVKFNEWHTNELKEAGLISGEVTTQDSEAAPAEGTQSVDPQVQQLANQISTLQSRLDESEQARIEAEQAAQVEQQTAEEQAEIREAFLSVAKSPEFKSLGDIKFNHPTTNEEVDAFRLVASLGVDEGNDFVGAAKFVKSFVEAARASFVEAKRQAPKNISGGDSARTADKPVEQMSDAELDALVLGDLKAIIANES